MSEVTDLITAEQAENPLAGLSPELQERIRAASLRIQSTASMPVRKIAVTNGGTAYRLPNDTVVDRFTAIIVAVKHANRLYTKPYVQGKPELAECVAVMPGDEDGRNLDLKPIAACAGKFDTDGTCETCPKFRWGSNPAGSGRGKLCTEYTLCVVYIPAMGDDLYLIEQKKARSAAMDKHLRAVQEKFGHPMMVYTQFVINEGGKAAYEQKFYATEFAPQAVVEKLVSRIEEANATMIDAVSNSLESNRDADDAPAASGPSEVEQVRSSKRGGK